MEQMVLQYEDSTINRFIHFVPVLGEYHITVERFAKPKLSDGHFTFQKGVSLCRIDNIHNDTFCILPLPSGISSLCPHLLITIENMM